MIRKRRIWSHNDREEEEEGQTLTHPIIFPNNQQFVGQKKQTTVRDVATNIVQVLVDVLATGGLNAILKSGAQAGIKKSFKQGIRVGFKKTIASVDKQGLRQVGKEMILEGVQRMDDEDDNNMGSIFMAATRGRRGR